MKRILGAMALLMSGTAMAHAEGELFLYNWGNYTSPEMIKKFEEKYGVKVTITDFDSNDTALAKVEAGASGFDLVVPSAGFVGIYAEKGLIQKLDLSKLPNHKNIAPEWMNVEWDPGREWSIPWQWGSTGMSVNVKDYSGDINTSDIFMNPPAELVGKINVIPEMGDVMALATMWAGGEVCSEDPAVMKKVRDALLAAKPKWMSMDYSTVEKMINHDYAATVDWNGSAMRARLGNPDVAYGYPKEGYGLWMDNVVLLADAKNVDNAYLFLDFIMEPENAAALSAFARYANGIAGSDAFMPEDMKAAPEIITPAEFADKGHFVTVCTGKALEYQTAIWTELQK
ncbi:extracellular solute-binding protein [Pseudogemmobacter blasticus]|uniref:Putrescine-binding periplasmic protein n=1 Tax=Fuscovulum blasticum DSM 2131 TaxID=1188250 RepID=A0A2T4J927_FUSBL|nr:extracellular solute-binding protein [Fuscovulum blasticum]PTE14328.1 putrescine/spermidine ABC transporter substrate-binding protein [Fuscovulum blasticum DSM 2131]